MCDNTSFPLDIRVCISECAFSSENGLKVKLQEEKSLQKHILIIVEIGMNHSNWLFFIFLVKVSLCSLGRPLAHRLDWVGFELIELLLLQTFRCWD